tara:strand:- start:4330 stop:4848 length:519 start_codon:yes stop_codon:yes gene_type:complete
MAKRQYRTASGKLVDMDTLALRNEYTIAVGNMNVNARGDQLGEGGQIVKTREDIMSEHYATKGAVIPRQTNSREQVANEIEADQAPTVEPEAVPEKDLTEDQEGTMEDDNPAPVGDEWVEDPTTGDFVKASEAEKPSTRGIASASAGDTSISVPFVESEQQKTKKKPGVKRL